MLYKKHVQNTVVQKYSKIFFVHGLQVEGMYFLCDSTRNPIGHHTELCN